MAVKDLKKKRANINSKDKVRDGFLKDLPEKLQTDIMNIHKIIRSDIDELLDKPAYKDLSESDWAMTCLDKFRVIPEAQGDVGSARIFKNGKNFKCIIQITDTFRNHQYGWIEDLLNSFINDLYQRVKGPIRRKYDIGLINNGAKGSLDEYFSLELNKKPSEEIWDLWEDKKEKMIKEQVEFYEEELFNNPFKTHKAEPVIPKPYVSPYKTIYSNRLPETVLTFLKGVNNSIVEILKVAMDESKWDEMITIDPDTQEKLTYRKLISIISNEIIWDRLFETKLTCKNDVYSGYSLITPRLTKCFEQLSGDGYITSDDEGRVLNALNGTLKLAYTKIKPEFDKNNPGKTLTMFRENEFPEFYVDYDNNYAKKLWLYDTDPNKYPIVESIEELHLIHGIFEAKEEGDAVVGISKLPEGLQKTIKDLSKEIHDELKHLMTLDHYRAFRDSQHDSKDPESKRTKAEDYIDGLTLKNGKDLQSTVGSLIIYDKKDGKGGRIIITTEPKFSVAETIEEDADGDNKDYIKKVQDQFNEMMKKTFEKVSKKLSKEDKTKTLKLIGDKDHQYFVLELESEYAKKLQAYIDNPKANPMTEAAEQQPDYNKEYNVEMSEKQAKKTLASLSQEIINKTKDEGSKYKVTQYTANIYANIITKNLLPKWAHGYRKFTITLDSYQSFYTFEFKIPTMSQDFVSRYIHGREPINGFLHRVPEIKVKMSPRIFHTMKDPDDAYNFFKAAIKYYDSKIESYAKKLMGEVMRFNHNLKHLVSTTKLSGLVTYPMQLLFIFDDVKMDNDKTFELSESDLKAVNQFMRNIYTRYAAPEKEKKKIVDDVKEMVKSLHEACEMSDNIRELSYLPEAVEKYLFEGYAKEIKEENDRWISEQIDFSAMREHKDPKVKILYERHGVKKLKKIPADLIAYITIEAESIRDANDKMMIASYCCSKIEIVEWYIQLLEVGSNKYIVPHTKPYLESIRTQLLACYKKIMAVKITPPSERPLLGEIKYPKGYEG